MQPRSISLSGSSWAVPTWWDASTVNLCRRLLEAKRLEESWRLGYCNRKFSRRFLLKPTSGLTNINMKSKGDSSQDKTWMFKDVLSNVFEATLNVLCPGKVTDLLSTFHVPRGLQGQGRGRNDQTQWTHALEAYQGKISAMFFLDDWAASLVCAARSYFPHSRDPHHSFMSSSSQAMTAVSAIFQVPWPTANCVSVMSSRAASKRDKSYRTSCSRSARCQIWLHHVRYVYIK